MLNFDDWIARVYENLGSEESEKIITRVADILEPKMGTLYGVPNFRMFKRTGEPTQYTILFTNDKFHTFTMNFTVDRKLYSIDFWKKENTAPTLTLYANGSSMESMLRLVPYIAPAPHKDLDLNKIEKQAQRKHPVPVTEDFIEGGEKKPEMTLEPAKHIEELETEAELKARKHIDKSLYKYGDPKTIFKDLKYYVSMVADGTQPSLVVTGSPGVGKTYLVTKTLQEKGLKKDIDYISVKGRATAVAMYTTLFQNNGKLIIFDDCDSVFKNEDAVNILKGALDSSDVREISWLVGRPIMSADGKPIPQKFEFTGRVIFISNLPQKKIDPAIKSRSYVLEVALSAQDMIDRIKTELPRIMPDVKLSTKEFALSTMQEVVKENPDVEINMRTLIKSINILMNVDDYEDAKRLIIQQTSYK